MKSMNRGSWVRAFGAAGLITLLVGFVILRGASAPPQQKQPQPYTTWGAFGGTSDSMQYSAFRQINKTNVHQLEQAWFYPAPAGAEFDYSPIVIDGVMYANGKTRNTIVALDAVTGKELWAHEAEGKPTQRGLAYWQSKDGSDRRIIFSVNSYLQEINARSGASIKTFGKDGLVDLREGLGFDPKTIPSVQSGMPGQVFENLIIQGSASGEGYDSPPGWLRAYDILTGKLVWTFHTIPLPGEYGYETWPPAAYKYTGGANTWSNFSIDEKRGIAYFPTGSATYDMYGARRHGTNLFASCLLALDARTGKRLWHFQTIHHDLWDYDNCNEPKLLTVRHNGKPVDIVAMGTKSGMLYVFNRVTGEPLWPIEERPVPTNDAAPGEQPWPTQPFTTKPPPMSRLKMTVDDINPHVDPAEREKLKKIFLAARHEGVFTPMPLGRDQVSVPGEHGGTNWGGTAGDPETGMLYVRAENMITIHHLYERSAPRAFSGGTPEQQGRVIWAQMCESCHGPDETGVKSLKERRPEPLERLIRDGIGGRMPGLGYSVRILTDANMKRLLAYVANPAAAAGDPLPVPQGQGGPRAVDGPLPNGETRRFYGQFGAFWLTTNGLSVIGPPWAELVAYDLNEGTIKWRIPLGTAPGLAAKGIKNTGSYCVVKNGPVVTAGGLIFMGTASDRTIRAYDKDTGKTLWEKMIRSNPVSIPAVYEIGGRQYVAFYASGVMDGWWGRGSATSIREGVTDNWAYSMGPAEAQGYYVYALPKGASTAKKK
jgi:quinoprotein glucose dehydrogenase